MYHLDEIIAEPKNSTRKSKNKKEVTVDLTPLDLATIYENNPVYGGNKYMDTNAIRRLDNYMIKKGVGYPQRVAFATNYHQEGNTIKAHGNGAYGIMGWKDERATPIIDADELTQLNYLYNTTYGKFDNKHWHHGGKGSGYKTAVDAQNAFKNASTVEDATKALTYGYVRPPEEDRKFRLANVRGLITKTKVKR